MDREDVLVEILKLWVPLRVDLTEYILYIVKLEHNIISFIPSEF